MQEQPVEAERFHLPVEIPLAVTLVAGERMAGLRRLHPDLVRTAGHDAHFEQGGHAADLDRTEDAGRRLAARVHGDHPLTAAHGLAQAVLQLDLAEVPVALDQCEITLLHAAVTQQFMQRAQGAASLGNEQATAGVAVQPVYELEVRRIRTGRPQRLDDAVGETAAAVHGNPGRLVEHDEPLVLVQDAGLEPEPGRAPARRRLVRLGPPHRRQAHHIARLETIIRFRASLVDPHLALAQQPVNMRLRHALEARDEEIVQPLPGCLLPDLHVFHGGARGTG